VPIQGRPLSRSKSLFLWRCTKRHDFSASSLERVRKRRRGRLLVCRRHHQIAGSAQSQPGRRDELCVPRVARRGTYRSLENGVVTGNQKRRVAVDYSPAPGLFLVLSGLGFAFKRFAGSSSLTSAADRSLAFIREELCCKRSFGCAVKVLDAESSASIPPFRFATFINPFDIVARALMAQLLTIYWKFKSVK